MTDAENYRLLEQRICGLEKLMSERRAGDLLALGLQAKEYERRLRELNSSHTRLDGMVERYLTKVEYEQRHAALEQQTERLARLVYAGLGLVIAIEFVLRFVDLP